MEESLYQSVIKKWIKVETAEEQFTTARVI